MSDEKTNKKITVIRLARTIAILPIPTSKTHNANIRPKDRKGYGKPGLLALYTGKTALKNAP